MLGLKLNHVSKRGHRWQPINWTNVDQVPWPYLVSPGRTELSYCFQQQFMPWFINNQVVAFTKNRGQQESQQADNKL